MGLGSMLAEAIIAPCSAESQRARGSAGLFRELPPSLGFASSSPSTATEAAAEAVSDTQRLRPLERSR
jgi:hypothetical protein